MTEATGFAALVLTAETSWNSWLEGSSAVFAAIRDEYSIGAEWRFPLESIEVDEAELVHPRAVAAFTLRKMQALEYVLRSEAPVARTESIAGLAADISRFIDEQARYSDSPGTQVVMENALNDLLSILRTTGDLITVQSRR